GSIFDRTIENHPGITPVPRVDLLPEQIDQRVYVVDTAIVDGYDPILLVREAVRRGSAAPILIIAVAQRLPSSITTRQLRSEKSHLAFVAEMRHLVAARGTRVILRDSVRRRLRRADDEHSQKDGDPTPEPKHAGPVVVMQMLPEILGLAAACADG